MVIFQWNPELTSGIDLIDRQHQLIVEKANVFFIAHKCGNDKFSIEKCLEFLQSYILYHFQSEEAFQVDCGYPKYRHHQALHTGLATQVKFLSVQLKACNYQGEKIQEFYAFLTEWIQEHIMGEDLDFARYYHEHPKV